MELPLLRSDENCRKEELIGAAQLPCSILFVTVGNLVLKIQTHFENKFPDRNLFLRICKYTI